MATIITCDNIEAEADRLLQLFRSCYTLTGQDMDDLVNLSYSASLCGTGSGSIPTFDQNNLFTYRMTNSGIVLESDPVIAINSGVAFEVDEKELLIYRHIYLVQSSIYTSYYVEDHYLHMAGKGDFGAGGTSVTAEQLYLLRQDINATLPTDPGATQPPRVLNLYAEDVSGSTISTPHTILNGTANLVTITNTQDTYFATYAKRNLISADVEPAWNLYRFTGAAGSYGTGVDTAILGDFTLVESFNGAPSTSIPNGQIKIREIAVPAVAGTTAFPTIADAVNDSFRGAIDIQANELVIFIIDSVESSIVVDQDTLNILTQKWAWNKGEQTSVNVGAEVSDFTLIETVGTTSVTSGSAVTNDAEIYYVEWNDITDVNDAVDAVNSLSGADRVVLNDNLVLVKTALDDGSSGYKIWEFTGAVTGDGTYGISGLTAVAGDFEATPVVDGTVNPSKVLTAIDILWDDTTSNLGEKTVQGAIDALAATIIGISSGSSFFTTGGALPNFDPSLDAYRTGRLGLGTTVAPSQILEITTTEAGLDSGIKFAHTYTNGAVTRFQSGGQNIQSEIGETASTLEGFAHEYFANTTDYVDNMRSFSRGGDFAAVGGFGKNFEASFGITSETYDRYSIFSAYPLTTNNDFDWAANMKSINEDGDTSSINIASKGNGAGYNLESILTLTSDNGSESTILQMTPHILQYDDLALFTAYGSGTFVQGYTHTDDVANTGTAATTIAAEAYRLGVDANGVIMETLPEFSTAIPDAYLGTRFDIIDSSINGFYFGRNASERVGVDIWNNSTATDATAGFVASRSSAPYSNLVSLQYFGINYFGSPLQDKGGLYTDTDMVFVGANNANFEWYGVPNTILGSMSTTPIMDLDTNGILRLQQTSVAEIDASANGDEVPTVDWVNSKIITKTIAVTLNSAEIIGLQFASSSFLSASSATSVIIPKSMFYKYNYGTATFAGTTSIDVEYSTGAAAFAPIDISAVADVNTFVDAAATASDILGSDLTFSVAGPPTTGDGDLEIWIEYIEIETA